MVIRLLSPSGDDWIVRARCRRGRKTWTRWIGVSNNTTREAAIALATKTINTPRTVRARRGCEILDIDAWPMHSQGAQKIISGAPERRVAEVEAWGR